ncbi:MAG: BrnT family toxin [Candidatus Marinimicrobia bacterium]|nr:BrnT family toxin [Candidatus Neomarinimicrobiota bacterium]
MKLINWNREKNKWLKENRNICFEDILFYIVNDMQIDDIEHPNQERYQGQRIAVLNIKDYVYYVPYLETEEEIFLKTIIPSRKATKKYLENKNE